MATDWMEDPGSGLNWVPVSPRRFQTWTMPFCRKKTNSYRREGKITSRYDTLRHITFSHVKHLTLNQEISAINTRRIANPNFFQVKLLSSIPRICKSPDTLRVRQLTKARGSLIFSDITISNATPSIKTRHQNQ